MFKMELSISMDKDSSDPSKVIAESENIISLKSKRNSLILDCCKRNRLRPGKGIVIQNVFEFDNLISRDRLHIDVTEDYSTIEVM